VSGVVPGGVFNAEYNKNDVLCFDAETLPSTCRPTPPRSGAIGSLECATAELSLCTVDVYVRASQSVPLQVRTATVYPVASGFSNFFCSTTDCNPDENGYLYDASVLIDRVAVLGYFPMPRLDGTERSELRFFGSENLEPVAVATFTPDLRRIVADRAETGLYGLTYAERQSIGLLHLDAAGHPLEALHLADGSACFLDLRELPGPSERVLLAYTLQSAMTASCGVDVSVAIGTMHLAILDPSTHQLQEVLSRQGAALEAEIPIDVDHLAIAIYVAPTAGPGNHENHLLILHLGDPTPQFERTIPADYVGAMDFDRGSSSILMGHSSPKGANLASVVFDGNGAPGPIVAVGEFELDGRTRQARPGPLLPWPHAPNTELVGLVSTLSTTAANSYLGFYDTVGHRYLPGVLYFGGGPTAALLPDGPNRIWTFLPWTAQLVRFDFEASR
jgi:hypothetical protein